MKTSDRPLLGSTLPKQSKALASALSIIKKLDFSKTNGLIPAIIQDDQTKAILMLGYMNKAALKKTIETKKVTFYSRTKKRLWQKGETSGNFLKLKSISFDCDKDTLLIQVRPSGPVCHTGSTNCFKRNQQVPLPTLLTGAESGLSKDFGIYELFQLIEKRKKSAPKSSYTSQLFKAGTTKILSKIKEESAEVVKAAKSETRQRLIQESCDLLYHLFVLCSAKKISLQDLEKELKKRNLSNKHE